MKCVIIETIAIVLHSHQNVAGSSAYIHKSLDTPSHSMVFLYFHDYLHMELCSKQKKCKITLNMFYILDSSK